MYMDSHNLDTVVQPVPALWNEFYHFVQQRGLASQMLLHKCEVGPYVGKARMFPYTYPGNLWHMLSHFVVDVPADDDEDLLPMRLPFYKTEWQKPIDQLVRRPSYSDDVLRCHSMLYCISCTLSVAWDDDST